MSRLLWTTVELLPTDTSLATPTSVKMKVEKVLMEKLIYPPRAQGFRQWQLPRCILTTSWSAGPWIQQPVVFLWGPGGQRRPHFAPCQCGTEALQVAAASSTRIPAPDGPSPQTPEAYRPPWYTAGKPQGWPASHSPGAVKPQRERGCLQVREPVLQAPPYKLTMQKDAE